MFTLSEKTTISCNCNERAVKIAIADLQRDLLQVAGCDVEIIDTNSFITVNKDDSLTIPEQYIIKITAAGINISGSDTLGVIYGIYKFTETCLNIDPLWFWKDNYPVLSRSLTLEEQEIHSSKATFNYRGWFLNDEDFLTEWHDSSGPRYIDYPFYSQVIELDIADAVYEAALRSGVNLIIPASFVDILNPPEAKLIEKAVERGLYVTQHHIEPLGVSHFGFENYWKAKGVECDFSYGKEPEKVIEAWETFAKRWYEIAGNQVIWQLGLRGKGDLAIWVSDPSVSIDDAGNFISKALREQLNILSRIDQRENPPTTLTLWDEMSELMAANALDIPSDIITIFSDVGRSQVMAEDFYEIPRKPNQKYGVYSHVAYFLPGSHLVPGTDPAFIERIYRSVIAKGDTEYAIINTSNIREHIIGIQANMCMMNDMESWNYNEFMKEFCGELYLDYQYYFDSYAYTPEGLFQDGDVWRLMMGAMNVLAEKNGIDKDNYPFLCWSTQGILKCFDIDSREKRRKFEKILESKTATLDTISNTFPQDAEKFYHINLKVYAQMLSTLYKIAITSSKAFDEDTQFPVLADQIATLLDIRKEAEFGKWQNWYRGDKKENWEARKHEILEMLEKK